MTYEMQIYAKDHQDSFTSAIVEIHYPQTYL